ncbi:MAG: lamin tail domain-containing protein, partial [Rubripirellula sp.]
ERPEFGGPGGGPGFGGPEEGREFGGRPPSDRRGGPDQFGGPNDRRQGARNGQPGAGSPPSDDDRRAEGQRPEGRDLGRQGNRRGGSDQPQGRGGERSGGAYDLDPLIALNDDGKPLRSKLLANDRLRTLYLQYVRQIAAESLNWDQLGPHVADSRKLIRDAVAKDTRKLMSTDEFLQATSTAPVRDTASRSIRAFAEQRARYLLNHEAIQSLPEKLVVIESSKQAAKPRVSVDDLKRADSPISLSEIMASNSDTLQDPQGDYDDWIEIRNHGDKPFDLSGLYLSDDREHALKWAFPAGSWIPPNGYLIIWADEDGKATEGLHANFKLSKKGEHLTLCTEEALLSELTFEAQSDATTFGSLEGKLQTLTPTPGAANEAPESKN